MLSENRLVATFGNGWELVQDTSAVIDMLNHVGRVDLVIFELIGYEEEPVLLDSGEVKEIPAYVKYPAYDYLFVYPGDGEILAVYGCDSVTLDATAELLFEFS